MIADTPDGVLRLTAGELEVALWSDPTYTRNSADNVHAYHRELAFAGDEPHSWQAVGVRVSEGDRVLGSAVLLVLLGCRGPDAETVIARPGTLYLSDGTEVAALDLPSLQVRWRTQTMLGCVMGLHEIPGEEALIAHGEISIARVEADGRIAWEQAGRDVLSGALRIADDAVEVTDWNGDAYRFRLSDGVVLAGPPPGPPPGPAPRRGGWMQRLRDALG